MIFITAEDVDGATEEELQGVQEQLDDDSLPQQLKLNKKKKKKKQDHDTSIDELMSPEEEVNVFVFGHSRFCFVNEIKALTQS